MHDFEGVFDHAQVASSQLLLEMIICVALEGAVLGKNVKKDTLVTEQLQVHLTFINLA